MTDDAPPIPEWLHDMPTLAGLVVPWVTPTLPDGRRLFGGVDQHRVDIALTQRLCGVCGRRLGTRLVLMMRLVDVQRRRSYEPGLHPVCAAYTQAACPMIAGTISHYRATPYRIDAATASHDSTSPRLGSPAEPWFAVWLHDYELARDQLGLNATYREPLKSGPSPGPSAHSASDRSTISRRASAPSTQPRLGDRASTDAHRHGPIVHRNAGIS